MAATRRAGRLVRRALRKGAFRRREDLVTLYPPGAEHHVFARAATSDLAAFEHVFGGAYALELPLEPRVIFDFGANVGYASVFFALRYPGTRVVAVEPEPSNAALLRRNVASLPAVEVIEAAVWPHPGSLVLEDPGKGRWGFRVREGVNGSGAVRAVSVPELMERAGVPFVDLVKIDIEGSEVELFSGQTNWLDHVGALVIELHDRFRPGCRDAIDRALAAATPRFREASRGEDVIFVRDDLV